MPEPAILTHLENKDIEPQELAKQVIRQPAMIADLMHGLERSEASVKYGSGKVLRIVSDEKPALLYSRFDEIKDLLHHENKIHRWEGMYLLANLAAVDKEGKISSLLEAYLAPILGPVMISANNSIKGSAKIALFQPVFAKRIIEEMLKVDQGSYETEECHHIVRGNVLKAFILLIDLIPDRKATVEFVLRHKDNPRPSTSKAAERFLKKTSKEWGQIA